MDKFIDDELDNIILPQASKIDSLAGGSYNEHVDEINKKLMMLTERMQKHIESQETSM